MKVKYPNKRKVKHTTIKVRNFRKNRIHLYDSVIVSPINENDGSYVYAYKLNKFIEYNHYNFSGGASSHNHENFTIKKFIRKVNKWKKGLKNVRFRLCSRFFDDVCIDIN